MSTSPNPKQQRRAGEAAPKPPHWTVLKSVWEELRNAPTLFETIRDAPGHMPLYISEYRSALERYAPVPEALGDKKVRILSLGCGIGDDAPPLLEHFGRRKGSAGLAEYTGVDRDGQSIELAMRTREGENCTFIRADARSLWGVVEGEFDVLVFAHPHMALEGVSTMIREGMAVHRRGGLLIATFYREDEMTHFHEIVKGDYEILHREERQGATHPAGSVLSVHDYILVGIGK